MTANTLRQIPISYPEPEERFHSNHPDFRVAGRIFATIGYLDSTRGMVKLSPEDQVFQIPYRRIHPPSKAPGAAAAPPASDLKPPRKIF
jgi:hypothetical protein